MVQIIQQMWKQVGFDVTISQIEQANLINDFIAGKFQAATSYQFGAVEPRPQLRVVEHHDGRAGREHRPQLRPQLATR